LTETERTAEAITHYTFLVYTSSPKNFISEFNPYRTNVENRVSS